MNRCVINNRCYILGAVTCECSRLSDGAVLVLCGDETGSGTEGRRRQQGQLLYYAAAARVVFRQLVEALLQGISQEVQFLTGLVKPSLGLERRGCGMRREKEGEKHQLHGPFYLSGSVSFDINLICILLLFNQYHIQSRWM